MSGTDSECFNRGCVLRWPSLDYWDSYLEALHEGFVLSTDKEKTSEEIKNIATTRFRHIESINRQGTEITLPDGTDANKEPFEMYWLVRGRLFIGAVGIIHKLNDYLREYGGHLGIGIRPSFRAKGFGTIAVRLVLARAFQLNINPVYAFCDSNNLAMARVFENCGGVLEAVSPNPYFEGTAVKRYKISLNIEEAQDIIRRGLIPSEHQRP